MKWKPWVSPVLLLTLSVPPAGAAVAPRQASPSSVPAISDAGPVEASNAADLGGARRARRRAESAFRDGVPIESLARAREHLRARAAGERPTAAASRGWETFYGACDGCIRSFATAMGVRGGADLDDCAQDVWADLMRSLPRFELDSSRGRFTSWLYAIVRSKAADQDRRRSRKPAINLSTEVAANLAAGDDSPLCQCERNSDRGAVRRAMAALRMQSSEKSYRVLHLRFCEGMSAPQVAGALDLTPQQVWVREHRMKKKLAALLAEYASPTPRAKCA